MGTLPSKGAGKNTAHPHGEILVQVDVKELERDLFQIRERVEISGGGAARLAASARVAPGLVVPAHWSCGRSDATDQGNGGNERDEGFVEQHIRGNLKSSVFSGKLRSLEKDELAFYKNFSMPGGKIMAKTSALAIDQLRTHHSKRVPETGSEFSAKK